MNVETTSGAIGKSRAANRTRSSGAAASSARGTLRLPAYGDLELGYVLSDDLGRSILWVQDANVYLHLGSSSLNFVFRRGADTRHTVRISTCEKLKLPGGEEIACYLGIFDVEQAGLATPLSLWIADHEVIRAPVILRSRDARKMESQLVENGLGLLI